MGAESISGPVRIPEKGIPRNAETQAAWTALEVASAAMQAHPEDPQAQLLYRTVHERFERVFADQAPRDVGA